MYDRFVKENTQDIIDYLCKINVITFEKYPNPIVKYTQTSSDNMVVIHISNGSYTTTYVEDMRDYFDWKILRDRKSKIEHIQCKMI